MTEPLAHNVDPVWQVLTRLGEAQILIPAALLMLLVLGARIQTRKLAFNWVALAMVAVLITTASKVAFLGWGLGLAEFNFTGFSGHAMFAAAIYPLLALTVAPSTAPGGSRLAFALGAALALMVGVSRLVVGAHSGSEVVAGLLLGGTASALAVSRTNPSIARVHPAVPILLLVWFMAMPFKLPGSQTHTWVTRLALSLSGHDTPFTRSQLLTSVRTPV
jgi:membrane-associated phospholipid phosphatase